MGRSFRIGSLKGVPLRVHWSFPLLVVLLILPTGAKTTARSIAEGVIWIAALFVCIVIHELSHSLVARRRGLLVRDIVLLPIGGVSAPRAMSSPSRSPAHWPVWRSLCSLVSSPTWPVR